MHVVFVYGSLLRGQARHDLLAGARNIGEVRTAARYTLYDLGEYPAMVEGGETSITFYRRTEIVLEDGRAEAYVLDGSQVQGRAIVRSGDWRARS